MLEDKKLKNKLRKRKSRAKIKNDAKLHKEYKLAECAYSKKYYKKKTLINSNAESINQNIIENNELKINVFFF
jgi:hypothetical protein